MIRLSVMYPQTDGANFDHDYYRDKHVPMACAAWGVSTDDAEIDRGLKGPYVAAVHFRFDSVEAMQAAMRSPKTAEVGEDRLNFTTIVPVMQTSAITS